MIGRGDVLPHIHPLKTRGSLETVINAYDTMYKCIFISENSSWRVLPFQLLRSSYMGATYLS